MMDWNGGGFPLCDHVAPIETVLLGVFSFCRSISTTAASPSCRLSAAVLAQRNTLTTTSGWATAAFALWQFFR